MSSVGTEKWRLDVAQKQNHLYEVLGDRHYDLIDRSRRNILQSKISKALFNKEFGKCTTEDIDTVYKTLNKILEISGSSNKIQMGYVFILIKLKDDNKDAMTSLIRIKKEYSDSVFFVEPQPGRIYTSWNDYEDNNKLPQCIMCYPLDGLYSRNSNGILKLKYRESPSCDIAVSVLDCVSGIGNLASVGVLLATTMFFPAALPVIIGSNVVLGTTAAYSVGRGVYTLVDRANHGESIAPDDPHALTTYISIGSNVVGAALIGGSTILPRLAAANKITSAMGKTTIEILSWISHAINGVGLVTGVVNLVLKCRDGKLGSDDITQFINTCLFFGNVIINTVMAERAIRALSIQPELLSRALQMAKNAEFKVMKCLIDGVQSGFSFVWELISGGYVAPILEYIGLPCISLTIKKVVDSIHLYKRNRIDVNGLITRLTRELYGHFYRFCAEIEYAVEMLTQYLGMPFENMIINGKSLFKRSRMSKQSPRIKAIEIADAVEKPISAFGPISNQSKMAFGNKILCTVNKFAEKTLCYDMTDYEEKCSFLTDKMKCDIDQQLIVKQSENAERILNDSDKEAIVDRTIEHYMDGKTMYELQNEYRVIGSQNCQQRALHSPTHVWPGGRLHPFDVNYEFWSFNESICELAGELLQCDKLFDGDTTFELHETRLLFFVRRGSSSVVFIWKPDSDQKRAIGWVLVLDEDDENHASKLSH